MKTKLFYLVIPVAIASMFAISLDSMASPKDKVDNKSSKSKKAKKLSKSAKKGKLIFLSHCAACHKAGKNQAKPSRPIVGSSTLATFATFKANLNKPIGNMPHYDHLINDEKLLKSLYDYTKTLEAEKSKTGLKDSIGSAKKSKR